MAKLTQNNYQTLSSGVILHDHAGQSHISKERVCHQIRRLSYHQLSRAFDGAKGSFLLDGIRYAMIVELDACVHALSSWREIAQMVKGREDFIYH